MGLRARAKHTVDVGNKPDGGKFLWIDGEDVAKDTKTFKVWYDEDSHKVLCEVTRVLEVDTLNVEGVDIVTMAAPNPWTNDDNKF